MNLLLLGQVPREAFGRVLGVSLVPGRPDIVVPSFNHEITAFRSDGTVFWRFNNDDTVFSGVAIGDLNGDGRLEVVVGEHSAVARGENLRRAHRCIPVPALIGLRDVPLVRVVQCLVSRSADGIAN